MSQYFIDFNGTLGPRYRVYKETETEMCLITPLYEDGTGFPTPKQTQYFDSQHQYTLFGGARGGGKSYAIVWDSIYTAYRVPGSRQMIFRRTMGELKKTIIDVFAQLPADLVGHYAGEQGNERQEFPNGSIIYFASAKDTDSASKYLSGEFIKITFDEWGEWDYETWMRISGSARTTKEYDIFGYPIIAQVKGCTNPGGMGADALNHLFGCETDKSAPKDLDIDYHSDDYIFIPAKVDDNPAYAAHRPAGKSYRKMLKNLPRGVRDAWLHGLWSGFEGQYFDEWDKGLYSVVWHDWILRQMAKQYWQPIFLSIDWGQVHHAYCAWHTLLDLALKDGKKKTFLVTFDEYLVKGLSERALAEEIVDRSVLHLGAGKTQRTINKIFLSPETFGESIRSRARNMGDVFAAAVLPRPQSANNERANGFRHMYTLLASRNQLLESIPRTISRNTGTRFSSDEACDWLISERCTEAIEGLPWAMSDPKKDGDIQKEGTSPKLDVLDGLRYGAYSHYVSAPMAAEARRAEEEAKTPYGPDGKRIFFQPQMHRYAEYLTALKTAPKPAVYSSKLWSRARRKH